MTNVVEIDCTILTPTDLFFVVSILFYITQKFGWNPCDTNIVHSFNHTLNNKGFVDLSFDGHPYKWANNQVAQDHIGVD